MKLSTILTNYDEFQTSYDKIGFEQKTINIRDKRQIRLLLENVITDINLFNDILNIYDYNAKEKRQILKWIDNLGYKKETFLQMLVEKNIDNLMEDESLLEDDYNDVELFENQINIEDTIEDMTFLTESKKPTLKENTIQIEEYFDDYGIVISDKFNLKKFANSEGLDQNTLAILICNLEDEKVMKDIAKGNYNTFDAFDSTQFNDDYEDMMSDLGMYEDDEDDYED